MKMADLAGLLVGSLAILVSCRCINTQPTAINGDRKTIYILEMLMVGLDGEGFKSRNCAGGLNYDGS